MIRFWPVLALGWTKKLVKLCGQYRSNFGPRWQKYLEVSGLSKKNARKAWPDIRHADVSLPPLETIQFGSLLAQLWPSDGHTNLSVIGVSGHSEENTWKEWPEFWHASMTTFRSLFYFGPLTGKNNEIGSGAKWIKFGEVLGFSEERKEGMAWKRRVGAYFGHF